MFLSNNYYKNEKVVLILTGNKHCLTYNQLKIIFSDKHSVEMDESLNIPSQFQCKSQKDF